MTEAFCLRYLFFHIKLNHFRLWDFGKIKLKKIFFFTFQNGYPSRRRSLVDDARFETIVVKQTKQSVLEEAREKANGMLKKNDILFRCIAYGMP